MGPSRLLPRDRSVRLAVVAAVAVVGVAGAVGIAVREGDDSGAAERTAPTPAAMVPTPPPTTPTTPEPGGDGEAPQPLDGPEAATVPDVPLAWERITGQAAAWPPATEAPRAGTQTALPTVPASRVRDTIGLNIDTWRAEDGTKDFGPVLERVRELGLRHARVNMSATGGAWGIDRLTDLGKAGVRLDLIMGDAFGRYGTAPYRTLDRRLQASVMPYVDSLEGTNEPDLAKEDPWAPKAREHQEQVVRSAGARRGRPVAVVAPSLGRIANTGELGSMEGLADAANAHAYSSAGEPSAAMDEWTRALTDQLPAGSPVVITEAGFQDDLRQRRWHSPLPAQIAADYVPRTILEAMRRGIPRVYLYEMINRWSDPFHVDTAAHFGLLDHELRPKPAWTSLLRLQRALMDGGRPDGEARALRATVEEGPADLRLLAFRREDGTAALALWRSVSGWDAERSEVEPVTPERVRVTVDGSADGALMTNISGGQRTRLSAGDGAIELTLAGAPVVIDGIR